MDQLREKARTVFLFQAVSTQVDLLRALLTGLGVEEAEGTVSQMQLRLKEALQEQFNLGKRVIVVIDEAQNLDEPVLELVRMLSNFETSREKLIQIILSGQPRLAEKIGSPELEQLRQRVSIVAGLDRFSREDTEFYVDHRLRLAGYTSGTPLFTRDALTLIANHSSGIPRNINNLCFNSMALGSALRLKSIGSETVREVIADLDMERFRQKTVPMPRMVHKRAQEAPAMPSPSRAPSRIVVWMLRVVPGMLVVLLLAAAVFAARWWPQKAEHAQTQTGVSAPVAAADPPPAQAEQPPPPRTRITVAGHTWSVVPALAAARPAPLSPQPVGSERTVSVTSGKTLVGICMESFGTCDPDVLQEIRKLNPELSNLDHIEIGQKIRIPASAGEIRTP